MINENIFEIGDQFLLPGKKNLSSEVFIIVGIRSMADEYILEAVCRGSKMTISINSKEVEKLGKEFHERINS